MPRWGLRFTLPGRQSLGLGTDYKELFIPSQQFTQTIIENLNIIKLDSHSNAHRRIRGPATNEKDVNFKSLMLICISPFGDGVSNFVYCQIRSSDKIIPKSYTVIILSFLFSTKGFI